MLDHGQLKVVAFCELHTCANPSMYHITVLIALSSSIMRHVKAKLVGGTGPPPTISGRDFHHDVFSSWVAYAILDKLMFPLATLDLR